MLLNACHDLRRSRLRRKDRANEDVDALPPRMELRATGSHPSLRMALERALAKITAHPRDVFLLYEVERFRPAEIAGIVEIVETASTDTRSGLESKLHSASNKRRGFLAPRFGTPSISGATLAWCGSRPSPAPWL